MTGESIPLRLHDVLTPVQPWDAVEAVDVDCYDTDGFATGEPIVRASTALGPGAHRVQAGDVLLSAGSSGPRRAWVVGEPRGRAQIAAADWHVLRSDAVATGYLRHLLAVGEPAGATIATLHNLSWLLGLVDRIREAIPAGTFSELRSEIAAAYD